MSTELIVIIVAIANLILFCIHTRIYREPKNRLRQIWAFLVIAIGIAIEFIYLPNWIYDIYVKGYTPLFYLYVALISGLLMFFINKDIKKEGNTFIILMLIYFAIFIGLREQYVNLHIYDHIPVYLYVALVVLLIGILHFMIDGIIRKKGKFAIIPSIQIFLLFSAYSVLFWSYGFSILGFFPDYLRMLKVYGVISIIAMLPEILGILGLFWLRKKTKPVGIVLILVALFAYAEIYPLRITFIHGGFQEVVQRISDQDHLRPFGQFDRKLEFARSLGIIENLKNHSKNMPTEYLTEVVLDLPNYKAYPEILSLEWKWEQIDSIDQIHKAETLMLDMKHDSDGDGLSDFMEAKLLSDAYKIDTDGDGFIDNADSDPLNPLIESKIAKIHAVILKSFFSKLEDDPYVRNPHPFCVISNNFWNGRGEIANFGKNVLLLKDWQEDLWSAIFRDRWDPWDEGYINFRFGRYSFDLLGMFVVVDVTHNWDGLGMIFLMRWNGEWHYIAFNL